MSADNGYVVSRLAQLQDEYGIYYYGSAGLVFECTRENATATYTNPLHAILAAHKLNAAVPTEYGVRVQTHVLADTHDYFQYNTNEIVKPLKERYDYDADSSNSRRTSI
jgi:hypothetical protein